MTFCEGEETQRETTGRLVEDVGFVNEILGGDIGELSKCILSSLDYRDFKK